MKLTDPIRGEGKLVDRKMHGYWIYWWFNGNKAREGEYINGKKQGLWTSWYLTGEKDGESYFVDDKENGWCTAYHRNGQKAAEGEKVEGKYHGVWIRYGEDGSIGPITTHNHGQADGECVYWRWEENDPRHGQLWKIVKYKNDQVVRAREYRDGVLEEVPNDDDDDNDE